VLGESRGRASLDSSAATWPSPSPGNSALTETNMSNTILYTTDENSTTGIREASFQEVLDAARLALAKRVRSKSAQIPEGFLFRPRISAYRL
jgi:hypothetical protein